MFTQISLLSKAPATNIALIRLNAVVHAAVIKEVPAPFKFHVTVSVVLSNKLVCLFLGHVGLFLNNCVWELLKLSHVPYVILLE